MNKSQLSRLLMVATIVLLAVFEGYWLDKLYHDEYRNLKKEVDVNFRDAMYKLQQRRFERDTMLGDHALPVPLPEAENKKTTTTIIYRSLPNGEVSKDTRPVYKGVPPPGLMEVIVRRVAGKFDSGKFMIGVDSNVVKNTKMPRHLSFNKVFVKMPSDEKGPSPMFRFLATNKTINDSIPIKVVDSAYKKELTKTNRKLPYTIIFKKYPNGSLRKADYETDSSKEVITSKVFVGYTTPYSYQAVFRNANAFVLGRMGQQIGGSVLLLLLVVISFIMLYRNLIAHQRLAVIKNDFISNITHELKTPIATVNVAIEALRNFGGLQSPERTKEYLDISASELQRLGLLVDKVLKLSMFENHEIFLQKESFDLLKLTEDVMASMKLQFETRKATAALETTGENFMIDADKLHISSVIYNLLDNALKYSKEEPSITIRLIRHEEYFELRVSDNGMGIPHEYKYKIFDQFFRVPGGDRHDTKGYGLGLSYVNHIVKRHQGFIEVETELGKGSTFIVNLPFAEADVIHYDRGRVMRKIKFKLL